MAGDCIEFAGTRNAGGYGVLPSPVHGSRLAHRAALSRKLGRPVEGVARHSCDNPACVNPEHLEEGSQADNVNDAVSRGRMRGGRKGQTHCKNGHELTDDNVSLYLRQSTRSVITARRCNECRRAGNKKTAARRKSERQAKAMKG